MHLVFWAMTTAAADAKAIAAGDIPAPTVVPEPPAQAVFMAPTPLFHVTACNCLLHPATLTGGTHRPHVQVEPGPGPRADRARARHELLGRADDEPGAARPPRLGPPRHVVAPVGMGGGGAQLQPDLVEKIDRSLDGGVPSTGYGLTETHGIVTANSARYFLAKPASCGPVMPTLDAKLVDDDGTDLPPGPDTVGQLCVRGPVVIKGYLHRPDATAESIRDGWFNTGDIARIDDDGFVFIVDRAKDMVLRGGENVYCSEVEAAIYEHDAVAEVAVFGVPDERLGEDVGAVIVLRDGADARRRRAAGVPRRAHRQAQDPVDDLVPRRPSCPATPTASSSSASCAPSSSAADRAPSAGSPIVSDRRSPERGSWRACSTSWVSWALIASMPSNLRSLRRKWAKRTWAGSP